MFVSDILKSKGFSVISVAVGDPVVKVLDLMREHNIGSVMVLTADGAIAGIVSERDFVIAMSEFGRDVFDKTVGDLMTSPVFTCGPDDRIASIMGLMTQNRFRHVPVVQDEKLIGIVSMGDVVKSRIEEAQSEVEALRSYISL
jgi:CBS domain-containing protein